MIYVILKIRRNQCNHIFIRKQLHLALIDNKLLRLSFDQCSHDSSFRIRKKNTGIQVDESIINYYLIEMNLTRKKTRMHLGSTYLACSLDCYSITVFFTYQPQEQKLAIFKFSCRITCINSPHLANESFSTKVTTGSSPVKSRQTAPATISATLPANRPTYYAMIYKPLFSMSSPYLQKRPISRLFHCCFFHSVPAR